MQELKARCAPGRTATGTVERIDHIDATLGPVAGTMARSNRSSQGYCRVAPAAVINSWSLGKGNRTFDALFDHLKHGIGKHGLLSDCARIDSAREPTACVRR
jgi:hypothetical protein